MKKYLGLIICILLVGCNKAEESKVDAKVQEIITLAENDGYKDFKIESINDKDAVLKQNMCEIKLQFDNNKISAITTIKNVENKEEYSCVMRTLVRSSDFLNTDEQSNKEFLEMFRDKNDFVYKNLKVLKDDYEMQISTIK